MPAGVASCSPAAEIDVPMVAALAIALDSSNPRLRATRGSVRCGGEAREAPASPEAPSRTGLASRYCWTSFRARWRSAGGGAKPGRAGEPSTPTQTRPSPPPTAPSCLSPTRGLYALATAASRARLASSLSWSLRPFCAPLWPLGTASGCACGLTYVVRSSRACVAGGMVVRLLPCLATALRLRPALTSASVTSRTQSHRPSASSAPPGCRSRQDGSSSRGRLTTQRLAS
jgi:hypothetical protein